MEFRWIESPDNWVVRLVRRLQHKKHRDAEGLFLIEGINLLSEALRRGVIPRIVLIAEDTALPEEDLRILEEHPAEVYRLSRRLFERISDAGNGVGVIAVVRLPEYRVQDLPADGNIVVLDRLQDPGNIGTIIRTAVAAEYRAVFALKGTADLYSLKVLRATAGMVFDIPVLRFDTEEEMAEVLRRLGKRLVVTVPVGGISYYEADLTDGTALVIGNEGNGISASLLERADLGVTIPMAGGVESLNAAVSAAILMYESVRGRMTVRK